MPRAKTTKLYRTSIKGLITEANALTYPEDATADELNLILHKKGNRSRRPGFAFDYLSDPGMPISTPTPAGVTYYEWNSPNNEGDTKLLVIQVGRILNFYDKKANAMGQGGFIGALNMGPGTRVAHSNFECEYAAGKGFLFVVANEIEPFYVEYRPTQTPKLVATNIEIWIRDFDGVEDGLNDDEEPLTLSDTHKYNLKNQGWAARTGTDPIDYYFIKLGRYPGNNKQWWVGKADYEDPQLGIKHGDFVPADLDRFHAGNARAPRGRFILRAFNTNRSELSGIAGLPETVINERPAAVAFFAGRAWYSVRDKLYFSQLLTHINKAHKCYQEPDPTSEGLSDLLDTDGGVIPLPEVGKVVKLVANGAGVIIYATNGIWFVTGGEGGFSATNIRVVKVSSIGTDYKHSIIDVGSAIIFWSDQGIMAMKQASGVFGGIVDQFEYENLSLNTIQSFYVSKIKELAKVNVRTIYDPVQNVVQWIYSEDGHQFQRNRVLNLDITLGAFFPWSMGNSPSVDEECYLVGGWVMDQPYPEAPSIPQSSVRYLGVRSYSNGFSEFMTGRFVSYQFADWTHTTATTADYDSFMETGYEILEDASRKKAATYVTTLFRRTEHPNMFTDVNDDWQTQWNSSCRMKVKWDFANSGSSGKWSTEIEAYRETRFLGVTDDSLFSPGTAVVITKNKVRGNGRAIQFRFSCNKRAHNFDLLGWSVAYTGNTEV